VRTRRTSYTSVNVSWSDYLVSSAICTPYGSKDVPVA
jgi:hypothetical protein